MTDRDALIYVLEEKTPIFWAQYGREAAAMLKADADEIERLRADTKRAEHRYKLSLDDADAFEAEAERLRAEVAEKQAAALKYHASWWEAANRLVTVLAKLDDMLDLKPEPMRMAIRDLILDLAKKPAVPSGPNWQAEKNLSEVASRMTTIWLPPIIQPKEQR
jgi:hypothetical protein